MVLTKHLLLPLLQKHSKSYYFQLVFNQLLIALVTNCYCNISFLSNKLVLESTVFSSLKGTSLIWEYDIVIEPPIYSLQPITMHVFIRVSQQERKISYLNLFCLETTLTKVFLWNSFVLGTAKRSSRKLYAKNVGNILYEKTN